MEGNLLREIETQLVNIDKELQNVDVSKKESVQVLKKRKGGTKYARTMGLSENQKQLRRALRKIQGMRL